MADEERPVLKARLIGPKNYKTVYQKLHYEAAQERAKARQKAEAKAAITATTVLGAARPEFGPPTTILDGDFIDPRPLLPTASRLDPTPISRVPLPQPDPKTQIRVTKMAPTRAFMDGGRAISPQSVLGAPRPEFGPPQIAQQGERSDRCIGAPVAPGTGSTQDELMAQARENAKEASRHRTYSIEDSRWFYNQVKNGGPWDYKQYSRGMDPGYQSFGNYNYGYTGAAAGWSPEVLLRMAGYAQQRADPSNPQPGSPGFILGGGTPPYADDPNDQDRIVEGYWDWKNGC